MPIKLKADYAHVVIGFNNNSAPLGFRDDLHLLITDAKTHNDTSILGMFEEIPDEETLLNEKEAAFNQKQAAKAGKGANQVSIKDAVTIKVDEPTDNNESK